MVSNKKVMVVALATVVGCAINGLSAFAANSDANRQYSSQSIESAPNYIQSEKIQSVDEVLSDPKFSGLTFDSNAVRLFKDVENFKKENPNLNTQELISQFDKKIDTEGRFTLTSDSYNSTWKSLTLAEKVLVTASPANALLVNYCKDKAVSFSDSHYLYGTLDGNGTKKDAFRHAIWNALMCKYISKADAVTWATAHEDHDNVYYQTVFDGFTGRQHTDMDLFNNKKGRDCWNILTDGILWTSDQTLQDRVNAKIQAGEMVVLR